MPIGLLWNIIYWNICYSFIGLGISNKVYIRVGFQRSSPWSKFKGVFFSMINDGKLYSWAHGIWALISKGKNTRQFLHQSNLPTVCEQAICRNRVFAGDYEVQSSQYKNHYPSNVLSKTLHLWTRPMQCTWLKSTTTFEDIYNMRNLSDVSFLLLLEQTSRRFGVQIESANFLKISLIKITGSEI